MSKIKVTIEVERETGEYEMQFNSEDGKGIEFSDLKEILGRVVEDWGWNVEIDTRAQMQ